MPIYYVYLYRHPDTLIPFYVGYGKNDRDVSHIKEAKNTNKNSHKLNTIRKILREEKEPIINIIDSNLSKEQACELEIFLISEIGRADLGQGPLTNLTIGGDGYVGWSKEAKENVSKVRKRKIGAKDPHTGETSSVKDTDPKWISGELVGHNKGIKNVSNKNGKLTNYIQAKNKNTGEIVRMKKDDTRWTSGEFVGINKDVPAHKNTIAAAKARKGIPKPEGHGEKVRAAIKLLKWYCNFELNVVKRCKDNEQPDGFIRVCGPHKKIPI